jgi:BirA family transcriptional regulator, biotin operon repressor / biotin---[acetyl-CoA-carboxylase] ligase
MMSLDSQILSALRAASPGAVSGAELSQKLCVSRAAVWARIEELRELGYDIQASPHAGYTLRASPDLLHAEDLLARLGAVKVIGRDIRVFQQTTSTNDVLEKLARDGVGEGAVVFAETQTRGRGRLGRKWVSPTGKGLWFSVLLRPQIRPQETTRLTITSATAVRRAIACVTGLQPEIKWPNDILASGKKLAGVLTEMNAEVDRVHYVIVGIGLNINAEASEFPHELRQTATSLRAELGHPINRAELAVAILREMDADYARLTEGEFNTVANEWADFCTTLGQQVCIRTGQRVICGRAEALGEDGALLVRTEHGHLEPVVGGDVTLNKEP